MSTALILDWEAQLKKENEIDTWMIKKRQQILDKTSREGFELNKELFLSKGDSASGPHHPYGW